MEKARVPSATGHRRPFCRRDGWVTYPVVRCKPDGFAPTQYNLRYWIFSMQTATSRASFSQVQRLRIGPERDGQRVDNCLAALLKGVPRSLIYRLLRTGQVRVNGRRVNADTRLAQGDKLRIPPVRVGETDHGEPPVAQVRMLNRQVILEDK